MIGLILAFQVETGPYLFLTDEVHELIVKYHEDKAKEDIRIFAVAKPIGMVPYKAEIHVMINESYRFTCPKIEYESWNENDEEIDRVTATVESDCEPGEHPLILPRTYIFGEPGIWHVKVTLKEGVYKLVKELKFEVK